MENTTASVKIGANPHVSEILEGINENDLTPQFVVDYFVAAVTLAEVAGFELFSQLQVVQEANRYLDRINNFDGVEII